MTTFLFVFAFIILVLVILMLTPVCVATKLSRSVLSCICSWLCGTCSACPMKDTACSPQDLTTASGIAIGCAKHWEGTIWRTYDSWWKDKTDDDDCVREGPGHRQTPNRPAGSKGPTGFHFFSFLLSFSLSSLWPPGTWTVIEGTLVLLVSLLGRTN